MSTRKGQRAGQAVAAQGKGAPAAQPKSKKPKPTAVSLADHVIAQLTRRSGAPKKQSQAPTGRGTMRAVRIVYRARLSQQNMHGKASTAGIALRNALDATAPRILYRGFQRRTPKRQRVSRLKRRLLAGRAEYKAAVSALRACSPVHTPNPDVRSEEKQTASLEASADASPKLSPADVIAISKDSTANGLAGDASSVAGHAPAPRSSSVWVEHGPPASLFPKHTNADTGAETAVEETAKKRKTRRGKRGRRKSASKEPDTLLPSADKSVSAVAYDANALANLPREVSRALSRMPSGNSGVAKGYCAQLVTGELDTAVAELFENLIRFQRRKESLDPIKAKIRKRYVFGLRETARAVALGKARCVLLAKNIECANMQGPNAEQLDEAVECIRRSCVQREIPLVYTMTRRQLGAATREGRGHAGGVACTAILLPDGADQVFLRVLSLAEQGRAAWLDAFCQLPPPALSGKTMVPWNRRRETPLWLACWYGYPVAVVQRCLAIGWPVDAADSEMLRTPLMIAAQRNRDYLIPVLLNAGARMDIRDALGDLPLVTAARCGHESAVRALLSHEPASASAINLYGGQGDTALLAAISHKHVACAHVLLSHPALDPNLTLRAATSTQVSATGVEGERTGMTPMLLTAQLGLHAIVPQLVDCQRRLVSTADETTGAMSQGTSDLQGHTDRLGRGPFALSCAHGHLETAHALLHSLSEPPPAGTTTTTTVPISTQRRSILSRRPLDRHAHRLSVQTRLLNQKDASGSTPLWWASANGHLSIVRWLCGGVTGALVDRTLADHQGRTPADVAALFQYPGGTACQVAAFAPSVGEANTNDKEQHSALLYARNYSRWQQLVHDIRAAVNAPPIVAKVDRPPRKVVQPLRQPLPPSEDVPEKQGTGKTPGRPEEPVGRFAKMGKQDGKYRGRRGRR
ncbi:hypothetical protein THASP1DRAFT_27949 [Thamnocephalis sphaerospora]|uniref:Ribosomal protein eL8/eL30/eS12/Gadd45 domain-containing protein n=1 Tax=Thamnocephalis sphaerospora TaxID=78915 RepID=A0A4P9XVG0_9FUNG|nr:hypothetical protein THASP1DRAFT_27949 [Thamnocephalis sphaerospora]|eukprot:RKP10265.1 hypothetical protein THASP1DRAFT_27949 [Thamnocephalis sphaerospora]